MPLLFGSAVVGALWGLARWGAVSTIISGPALTVLGLIWAGRFRAAVNGGRAARDAAANATRQATSDGEAAERRARQEETAKTEDIRIRAEERGRKEGRDAHEREFKEAWSDERIVAALRLCPVTATARVSHPKPDVVINYETSFGCPFNAELVVESMTLSVGGHEIKSINVGREIPIPPGAHGGRPGFVFELSSSEADEVRQRASCERHSTGALFVKGQIKCRWTPLALTWKGLVPLWVDIS